MDICYGCPLYKPDWDSYSDEIVCKTEAQCKNAIKRRFAIDAETELHKQTQVPAEGSWQK